MRLVTVLATIGCAWLLCSAASAAEPTEPQPSVDLRGYRMPMDHRAGMYLEPATSPDTGEVTVGTRLNYAFRPIVLRDDSGDRKYSIIEHQLTADVAMSVGLFHVFAVGLDMPFVVAQAGDDVSADATATALIGSHPLPRSALGDPGLVVKATFIKPEREDKGVGFGLLNRFTVPLGDRASFLSEASVTDEARLLFDGHFIHYFTARANAGAKFRGHTGEYGCGATPEGCFTRFGHELLWGAGLEIDSALLGIPKLTWFAEARGYLPLSPVKPFQSRAPSGSFASVAASYAIRDVSLFAGSELALDSGVGNAPFRITLGVSFAPRDHDRDHDGIEDDADRCPDRPEDRDGVEDQDGCPEAVGEGTGCDTDIVSSKAEAPSPLPAHPSAPPAMPSPPPPEAALPPVPPPSEGPSPKASPGEPAPLLPKANDGGAGPTEPHPTP